MAVLNAMCNDDVPEITVQKSTRMGYTKMLMATGLNGIYRHRSVVTWQPTDGDSDRFVKVEVDTAIRDSPDIRAMFKSDPDKRNSDNTLKYKGFIGANWDLRGGTSAKNYRAMTKDIAIYDELDGFDENIDNEGSAVKLGDKRLQASPFPKSIRGSTPRLKHVSQIEKLFKAADYRFYRYVPCPECFHYQRLEWKNVKWQDHDYKTAHYECEACRAEIDYSEYADMDSAGIWRTIDNKHWCDEQGNVRSQKGEVVEVRHVAFFIWAAYSYFVTWKDVVREFLEANAVYKRSGDTTELQTFTNTVLAETWEENQGEQPNWEILRARAEPYALWTIPMDAMLLVASVDTQNNRLELLVEAYGRGEECWTIGHVVLIGDPFSPEPWAELDEWLEKPYRHESGAWLQIKDCGIDSGGQRTQAVYNYVRKSKNRVYALKGMNTPGKAVIGTPTPQDVTYGGEKLKHGVRLWPVGSDTAKAVTYGRYKITEHGPGYHHTPIGLPDSFYEQATAEKLVIRMHKGFPITEWHCTTRNEITDLRAYGYATAVKNGLLRMNWDKQADKLQKQAEKLQSEAETATFLENKRSLGKKPSLYREQIKSKDPYM